MRNTTSLADWAAESHVYPPQPAGMADGYGARVHEVLRLIRERARSGSQPGQRTDGNRIALSIEGGGMRGTVSAGMALALFERGLVNSFDAVYGSSAGALSGA